MNGEDSLGLTYEKELKGTGITEHKHYLQAGGITFAMHTMRVKTAGGTIAAPALPAGTNPYSSVYLHHDQLGSIVAMTNTSGVVVERLAYDPWGKRRFINGTADTLDAITSANIDRGFTMHEHIDEMGIINMNGRIYDPLIGRFMSADPYIQAPDDLQSHNRYAYVMNNPLNLDDPSGYWSISKAWKKIWKSPIFKAIVGIAVAIIAPALLVKIAPTLFVAGSLPTALATGALSGFASTGTLKGALTGAFTAGIMFGVGTLSADLTKGGLSGFGDGGIGKIALHAGAGCITSAAGGGSCKSGALSGALGEFGHNIDVGPGFAAGVAKSAMMGGIGSKVAGGKFADGATTGAFGYLFNYCHHNTACDLQKVGEKLIDGAKDFLGKIPGVAAEAVETGAAVCGLFNPACRGVDSAISIGKAGYSLITQGDGKAAVGVGVGESSQNLMKSGLTVANANAIPALRIARPVVEGVAFATGKLNEHLWLNHPNQPK